MTEQKLNEIFSQVHNDAAIEADHEAGHTAEAELLGCEESHGSPFRYCACGWMEAPPAAEAEAEASEAENPYCSADVGGRECVALAGHDFDCLPRPLTDSEKIDAVYSRMLLLDDLLEQAGPLLEQAGPLLASAGPLLAGFGAQQSSPMGRILGSMLR